MKKYVEFFVTKRLLASMPLRICALQPLSASAF